MNSHSLSHAESKSAALETFVAEHRAMFQRVAARWYRPNLASTFDDYRQAMTVAITEHWHELPTDPEERTAWIWRILGNAAQSLHLSDQRAIRRRHTIAPEELQLDETAVGREVDPAMECECREELAVLRAAVDRLPPERREVLARYYGLDGQAGAERATWAALQLGLPLSKFRHELDAALTAIRAELVEGLHE